MNKAGAGTPSANRISLLRDADGDGKAEVKTALLEGLNSPYGMALVGDTLYVANTDAVMAYPFAPGQTKITAAGRKIVDFACGSPNNHWTRNLLANADGTRLYVGDRLCHQYRRKGAGGRKGPRADHRDRPGDRQEARLCRRPAQPRRHGLGAEFGGAVDRGQRTRHARAPIWCPIT